MKLNNRGVAPLLVMFLIEAVILLTSAITAYKIHKDNPQCPLLAQEQPKVKR